MIGKLLPQNYQNGFEGTRPPSQWVEVSFLGVKQANSEADHSQSS